MQEGRGKYGCSLRPMQVGKLEVQAFVDGELIGGVFVVNVTSGAACAERSSVAVSPTSGLKVSGSAVVSIEARDKMGVRVERGEDAFEVEVLTEKGRRKLEVRDHHDGTYEARLVPEQAGKHEVHVTLGGKHVEGSPVQIDVEDGDASAEHSSVDRSGLEQLVVGEEGMFSVQCNDCFGNATESGVVSAKASWRGSSKEEEVKVVREGKGKHGCSVRPMQVGKLEVQAFVDGELIGGVFVVNVTSGAACAERSSVAVSPTSGLKVSGSAVVSIEARDDCDVVVENGDDPFIVEVKLCLLPFLLL